MAAAKETIVAIKDFVTSKYGPNLERIYLFGSRARGDAKPDSDWDVLVVLTDIPDREAAYGDAKRFGDEFYNQHSEKIDIMIRTDPETHERTTIMMDAIKI